MGYQLTSLGNLPVLPDIDLYIFVVDGNWRGGRLEILEDNFSEIARAIGPKAIIAKGFEESLWSEELCRRYLGEEYDAIFPHLPALLITNAHPEKLSDMTTGSEKADVTFKRSNIRADATISIMESTAPTS